MKIEKLLTDYGIDFATTHKNIRDGWIGLPDCPFCGSSDKYHLGYSLDENYFSCWQCGGHGVEYTLQKILHISRDKAVELIRKYGGKTKEKRKPAKIKAGSQRFKLPPGQLNITPRHEAYLRGRGFDDVDALVNQWGLMGTAPIAKIDQLNYGNRILAPIFWGTQIVSFQARDITGQAFAKYMACPPEREIISHKHVLYGIPGYWGKKGICVEGIVDVWRFGVDSFATLGIKYTRQQLKTIKDHFEEITVIYDPEKQAQIQARKLVNELKFNGVKAKTLNIHSDPGDLSQEEADIIVEELLK